ncbi:nucleotidyltransferase domain-containing protein [Sporomusa malonica]|uniref:Uncharacterized nucleotidyltransferase n=1 Tax=Sporomusa malonica TaxID=112901 RepID=A0A1W2DKP7_9FIRM|nr:nucleotidyltransferase family protein [Sporomusa malonica]SMC97973.1 Uncharacterised nucleotidyltransferase [Sporomusa malonica]
MKFDAGNIYNELSPELRLVLLCSSLKRNDNDQDTIDTLIDCGINWPMFIHLVLHHRVYPLVYRYLSTLEHSNVPDKVLAALYKFKKDNDCKTLQMSAEFVRILRALEQKEIFAIVMKGFPLAYQLYGDITLRMSRDLDLLVHPEDVDEARRAIESNGYVWKHPLAHTTPARFKKWMESNKHLVYWHPELEICIELHWRLDSWGMDFPLNVVKNNMTSMQMFGQSVNILDKEELLLYLVIHGAVHAWFRVKWLVDIDLIVRKGDFSWERLFLLADSLSVKSVLNQAIILLRELLQTSFPKEIIYLAEKDRAAQALAVMALRFIKDNGLCRKITLKEKASILYKHKRYEYSLHSGWRGRALCISRCFIPSVNDLELILLSERLYFLYYIISPIRWIYGRTRNVITNMARGLSW